MYAICSVLCPSTIDKVQSKYLGLVSYAQDSKRYDWSTIVLNDLKRNLKKFISTFNKQGYTKSCGGCVFVLLIIYLDNLARQPVQWLSYPRIGAWTDELIREARKADKIKSKDYGKIGFGGEIWYGLPHPKQTHDLLPPEEGVPTKVYELHKSLARQARPKKSNLCPNDYLQMAKLRRQHNADKRSSSSLASSSSSPQSLSENSAQSESLSASSKSESSTQAVPENSAQPESRPAWPSDISDGNPVLHT
ncbi:uncharacterized protein LOC104887007 [Beta vulgaris subsp. vulgaris]|uniref:uncharacterized protein LOC104887007 n=1 Tax=Beta vulgaris subsp. vulgaris TaxID=3555 RepID=UPI00254666FD|nr:uncharacterized protein LOC104887007 [Beta vulgaris subsp. vulgaris]